MITLILDLGMLYESSGLVACHYLPRLFLGNFNDFVSASWEILWCCSQYPVCNIAWRHYSLMPLWSTPNLKLDHCPLLICTRYSRSISYEHNPFRFQAMWLLHKDFSDLDTENDPKFFICPGIWCIETQLMKEILVSYFQNLLSAQ